MSFCSRIAAHSSLLRAQSIFLNIKTKQMRDYTLYIILIFSLQITTFAQRRYENGVIVICPCEISKFIQENLRSDFWRPFIVSPNCEENSIVKTTAPEGFYLFGHRKKKYKARYPRNTNAIFL